MARVAFHRRGGLCGDRNPTTSDIPPYPCPATASAYRCVSPQLSICIIVPIWALGPTQLGSMVERCARSLLAEPSLLWVPHPKFGARSQSKLNPPKTKFAPSWATQAGTARPESAPLTAPLTTTPLHMYHSPLLYTITSPACQHSIGHS
ncbi:hypothetical protein J6590_033364 [Homalodisca vitripennis]|nr:hypothetical protein J6590_033364 [Homalodisca vitripennis]